MLAWLLQHALFVVAQCTLVLPVQSAQVPQAEIPDAGGLQGQSVPSGPIPDVEIVGDRLRDAARVRSVFEDELSSPTYKRLRQRLKRIEIGEFEAPSAPNWWTRFWTWFRGLFARNPAPPTQGSSGFTFGGFQGGTVIVWALFGILLVILVAFIIKSAAVRISDEADRQRVRADGALDSLQPSVPPGELPSDEYMRRAMELAGNGDHRSALRQLVLGGMSWIERAGLIRFRRGLTNRDYVRAVYRRKQQRQQFAEIVRDFERVYFGRREATLQQFQECLDRYRDAFAQVLEAEDAAREAKAADTPESTAERAEEVE